LPRTKDKLSVSDWNLYTQTNKGGFKVAIGIAFTMPEVSFLWNKLVEFIKKIELNIRIGIFVNRYSTSCMET
jgi:hypothetical protein